MEARDEVTGEAMIISDHRQREADARGAPKILTDGLDMDCYIEKKKKREESRMCQLPTKCFSDPNLPFTAYSVKIKMNPLNIFPMPNATMLSFVCRGTGKTLHEEQTFLSASNVLLLAG